MQDVISQYRAAIGQRRIHLKPVFQDFDITRNGHVTKHQFLRVLDLLRVATPEAVTSAILRRYMDMGNVDEVNYVDFCEEVDGGDDLFGVGRDFNHSWDLHAKTIPRDQGHDIVKNCPDDVDDVIARIRTQCSQQRTRVAEFFRDFDKLRSGYITCGQFRIGLNMAKLTISAAEFKLLSDTFKAPKAGDHINWRDFSDKVDEVFVKKGLEKNLDMPVDDARTQCNYGRSAASSGEKARVQRILDGFTDIIRKQRLDAKSFF
jgi:Ca2+-binding EF-hand superfamily protein